jgi:Uma2 family endonuclease
VSSIPAPRHRYTFEEYLEIEEVARVRHEFYEGEIYAVAGGTPEHAAMAAAITTMLGQQLGGTPCRVYSSDLRSDGDWQSSQLVGGESVQLTAIGCVLGVDAICAAARDA